ncbi:MAG: hypothetical protein KBC73_12970 [Burkholderiaceae bacterium]|nr:hypothetical protein [Burkholderiaceae bacterium]
MKPTDSHSPPACPPARGALRSRHLPLHLALVAIGAGAVSAPPLGALSDPTRPPAALQPAAPGVATARAIARAASAAPAEPLPQLQGVQLPARGAPSALLDGRVLRTGDSVAGRRVLAIDNQGVTLSAAAGQAGGTTERLNLLDGDAKQPPGSIQITRSARYTPGAAEAEPAPRELPLSVAERTRR